MERETEPMAEAPLGSVSPTRKWVSESKDLWSADAQLMGAHQGMSGKLDVSNRESLQGSVAGIHTG